MTSIPPGYLGGFDSNNPQPSSPLHRHQSSLHSAFNLSAEPALGADQRFRAEERFKYILERFNDRDSSNGKYKRTILLRLMYEHALSEESRDIFLRAFFQSMNLSLDEDQHVDFEHAEEELYSVLVGFADYLLDNFFLPCRLQPLFLPWSILTILPISKSLYQKNSPTLSRISFRGSTSTRRTPRVRRYTNPTINASR